MAERIIGAIMTNIINPLILLLFVLALAYFLWGLAEFIWASSESTAKEEGKEHMKWGIIGLFIMASFTGIIALIENTIGA